MTHQVCLNTMIMYIHNKAISKNVNQIMIQLPGKLNKQQLQKNCNAATWEIQIKQPLSVVTWSGKKPRKVLLQEGI